ncbi:MAG: ATP-binding protein [Bacteroidota bacterium]|jgi:PAS domain S-box-containing protein
MQLPFFNSLRFKIGVGYIILVVINVGAMLWTMYNIGKLTDAINVSLGENYPNVIAVENLARSVERHEHALSLILNNDLRNGKVEFTLARDEFFQWFQKAGENRTIALAGPILGNIQSTYEGYLFLSDSLMRMASRKDFYHAKAFHYNSLHPFYQRLTDNCYWLIEENQKQMAEVSSRTKQTAGGVMVAIFMASLLAIGLSILTMIQFTKRIIEPAERLTDTVHAIGRGRLDLKIDVETNDEVGVLSREFNKMTERLRKFEEMNIEKILAEKQKSEAIVSNISDAIIVCDPDEHVLLMNHSAEELLKVREQDVVGKHVAELTADIRLLDLFGNPTDSASLNQPYLQFSYNDRVVYLRPRVSTIPTPHSERGGVVLVLQDVTQFKELDKMKSDFMATVTHEFRTPVTSITMGVDILRQHLLGPLTAAQEELLGSFKEDCGRLTKLVRELLQLSKLETGEREKHPERVDLKRVIESTLQPLQVQFGEKGVSLRLSMDPNLPALTGDEQQISWVISNLATNALRYTDTGGNVEIVASADADGILVRVRDTGRGIPREYQDKIFDKFVQVRQAWQTTPGSVGLGLAIAKEIVEMYGGKIWVESEVNKGSTFSFRLPIEHPHEV